MNRNRRAASAAAFAFLILAASFGNVPEAQAAAQAFPARAVRVIETADVGAFEPLALAYVPAADALSAVGAASASTLVRFTPTEDRLAPVVLDTDVAASGLMTMDTIADRVLLFDRSSAELIAVPGSVAREAAPAPSVRAGAAALQLGDVRGIASDASTGAMLVLDATGRRIVRVDPEPTAGGPLADLIGGRRSFVALQGVPGGDLTGLAVHPDTGHLFVFGPSRGELYEIDRTGRRVATYPLGPLGVAKPTAMVFAPSGDPTDAASTTSLYIADRGQAPAPVARLSATTEAAPSADGGVGSIVEVSFDVLAEAAVTDFGSLVQTINTYQWSPPSPDPAGIVYLPGSDRLLVVDSEVNEMAIYTGKNVYQSTRTGQLVATNDTTTFTKEPTGIARNPADGHLFISDDDARTVYEVDPGPDGEVGTGDDVVTSFSTAGAGSTDPEDVAYDSLRGEVLIIDGLAREVYRISRGPNGVFDGIDDAVSSFDVQGFGLIDPEGITYDAVRDTMWVAERGNFVVELTADGQLLRTIDIAAANALNPSAVELAPGSVNPSARTLWIADRAVDNGQNPNENDGKIYELSFPAPTGNLPPSVSAGPDQQVILPAGANLDGSVTDDGLPAPPGTVATTWAVVSGPGPVTFSDIAAVDVTATFTTPGTYVLQLTADDGGATVADRVTVIVFDPAGPFTIQRRVAGPLDDAEERPTGAIWHNADLEMTFDAGDHQQVGLRYVGVDVPQGATINQAWIQFEVDEPNTEPTNLVIQGHSADNPLGFGPSDPKISVRPRTAASVAWSPPSWLTVGEVGPDQRTPNLAGIVQEIIDRPGWASGNAMVLIVTGTGERTAVAYEGSPGGAPLLFVEYSLPSEPPPVAVSVDSPSVVEGAGPLVFTVSLDGSSGLPVEVTFAVTGGSATAGVDYTSFGPVVVSFAPGEVAKSVSVAVVGDDVAEGDESVIVELSSPVNAVMGSSSGVGTIVDDDAVGVVVSPTVVSVSEGGSGVGYSVVLTSQPVDNVTVTAGIATGEVGVSPSVVVFGAGDWDVPQVVTVVAVDDAVADGTTGDVVSHVVSSVDPGYDGIVVDDVVVTVFDNEGAPSVSISDASAVEGDTGTTSMTFDLTLSPVSETPVSVTVTTNDGTAVGGTDYVAISSGTATFAAGSAATTLQVTIIGDTLDEFDETFTVSLSAPTGGAALGDATGLGTILDDDLPPVSVVASDAAAAEQGQDPGTFVVSRQGTNVGAVVVAYSVTGSATPGSDYVALSGTVTLADGQASAPVVVTPIDDGDLEDDETVILTIIGGTGYVVGLPASASITISDNDGATSVDYVATGESTPTGSITAGSYTSTHVSDNISEAILEASSGGPQSRRVSSLEQRWSFAGIGAADSATFSVEGRRSINGEGDDFRFEYSVDGGSTFQAFVPALIVANTASDATYTRPLPPGISGTVIIRAVDTDRTPGRSNRDTLYVDHLVITTAGGSGSPIVSVTADDPTASEAGDPGRFRLSRTVTAGPLTVNIGVGGSASPGVDYQALPASVAFAAGQAVAFVNVVPIDDGLTEGAETVVLNLLAGGGYVIGTPSGATVTITDDDQTTVTTTASAQTTLNGSVTAGNLAATYAEDDVYEVISEELYGGSRSRLEHRWTFQLSAAGTSTLYLDAHHTPASENFTFAYSTDGSNWITTMAVTKTADNDVLQTFLLPAGLTGTVYVRVLDDNRSRGDSDVTSIYVDALYITTIPS